MTSFLHDLRYGLRLLVRHRGFSVAALCVLGIGIGVVTTVVSIANSLLLRPPAVHDPSTLARVFSGRYSGTPLLDLLAYEDASTQLAGIAAFREARLSVRVGRNDVLPLFGTLVTGNYFDVVGVPALRGRTFSPDEGRKQGGEPVAVLSHRAWLRHFDGDPSAIGRPIFVNGQAVTVIGVMPESFIGLWGPIDSDLWLPVTAHPLIQPGAQTFVDREAFYAQAVARMKPGVTMARAQAELDARYQQWQQRAAAGSERSGIRLEPLHYLVPELWQRAAIFLAILGGLTASVLGIVCLNVANLLLAKNGARAGELGVRLSLGASRTRLVRQLLTESGCLAIPGAVIGAGLAYAATRALGHWTPPAPVPIVLDATPDWRVLLAVCAITAAVTLLVGLAPAWTSTRRAVAPSLGQASARASGAGRTRLRATLLIAQVSLSLVLLSVAGLLVRSLDRAERIDLGFEPGGVLMMALDLDSNGYSPDRGRQFYADLVARARTLPGVRGASVLDVVPLTGSSRGSDMRKEGVPAPASGRRDGLVTVGRMSVGDGQFSTMRIPFVMGRDFAVSDTGTSLPVAIVNETLARTMWPGESPLGKRLRMHDDADAETPLIEVVGLVRDAKYVSVGEAPRPFMYRPLAQEFRSDAALIVRTDGDPLALVPGVRGAIRQLDPSLPVFEVRTLLDATSISLLPIRVASRVVGALAVAVLALAAMGIYGVLSYLVGQRTREIGIRMALGAGRPVIVSSTMREALVWIGCGTLVGLALAFLATPLASSLLYDIEPHDPSTLAGVTVLLLVVGLAAALSPSLRASRLEPADALKSE